MLRLIRPVIRSSSLNFKCTYRIDFSTSATHAIKMPGIMNSKEGMINSWSIKVGDSFRKGDRLCEIALPVATIGIDAKEDGTLAKIIVDQYKTVPADSEIALYTLSREKFLEFIAESMVDAQEAEKLAEIAELEEEKIHKPDAATLMRVIKHMIQQGSIKSGSGFAKKLQSLARKADPELIAAFEASYEGNSYNEETFDEAFFLENARDIVNEDEHSD